MASAREPFEERRELGRGASGRVLLVEWIKATQDEGRAPLNRGDLVAVKRRHPDPSPALAAAFEAELELGQRLDHPHLLRLLAWGTDWHATEWLSGPDLAELLDRTGPLEGSELVEVATGLASALAYLHGLGYLHGDLKPENARLDGQGRVRLLDLGFAAPVSGPPVVGRGSPRWLSPEELRGQPRTPASEVFALGTLLTLLATGEHPFLPSGPGQQPAPVDLALRVDRALAPRPSARAPRLAAGLEALLEACLDPVPSRRPSAPDLAEALAGDLTRYPQPAGPCPFAPLPLLPVVGRADVLRELETRWRSTGRGRGGGSALWLEQREGAGALRLLDEFAREGRRGPDPVTVLTARVSRFADAPPLQPLLDLLRSWLHASSGRPPGPAAAARLAQLVPRPSAEALLAALTPKQGVGPTPVPAQGHLHRWLAALARRERILVVLHNIDQAGESALRPVARLVRTLGSGSMALALTLRTDRPARSPRALARVRRLVQASPEGACLTLPPYGLAEHLELVERTFAPDVPRRRVAQALLQRTEGLPEHLEEYVETLLRSGALRSSHLGWVVETPPERWPRPSSGSRLLDARLASLPLEQRLWLQRLATCAQRLEPAFLARTFGHIGAPEMGQLLETLRRDGWLERAGGRYRFARGAQRAAVRRATPEARRERLHRRVAAALAREAPGALGERAYHLHRGREFAELARLMDEHLEDLRRTQPARRALTLASWGLDAVEELGEAEDLQPLQARLLEWAADSAGRLGRREEQRTWLDRLADLDLDEARLPGLVAGVYLRHGLFAAQRGRLGLARGLLRNGALAAERAGLRPLLHEARLAQAEVQGALGQLAEARRLAQEVLDSTAEAAPAQRAAAHLALGLVDLLEDRLEAALGQAADALRALHRDRRPQALGLRSRAHLLQARVDRVLGRIQEAWSGLRSATALVARADDRTLEVEVIARRGRLLLESGSEREAELELREARWQAREIEDAAGRTTSELFLAILLCEAGDPEGEELLEAVRRALGEQGQYQLQALAEALSARVNLRAGQQDSAEVHVEVALRLLETYGAELQDRIVIEGTAALVALAAGRRDQARDHERRVLDRVRLVVAQVQAADLRRRLRRAAGAGLRAALSPEGPVYPRRGSAPGPG